MILLETDSSVSENWKNWKWQMQNRIRTLEELREHLELSAEEISAFDLCRERFDFGVSPYYLSLSDRKDPNCPIRRQIVPSFSELEKTEYETEDPLGEEAHMPVKGVTHRYPDRALWYLSHSCAVYCRFCTRKRKVGQTDSAPGREEWEEALQYFRNRTEIREVILSGGDPLSRADSQIEYILEKLRDIPHINHIRIHSRYPVTLPFRITDELCTVLRKFSPIFFVTHFNHAKELTEDARSACKKLHTEGNVILLNQSVLLSGINDSAEALSDLFYGLISFGIKPYYLHQCDDVFGSTGFKVPMKKGMELMKQIRGHISGIAVPQYVADLTGGGGKVPVPTDYLLKEDVNGYYFRNYKGEVYKKGK